VKTPAARSAHAFPVLRWVALAWLVVWLPAYIRVWGLSNVLHLCDAAVLLTCIGIWCRSAPLLSSQALSATLPGLFWFLNVFWKFAAGRFLFGGSEYMWNAQYPLWVRLLSFFHVVLPLVLFWTVCKLGYDGRALALQTIIAAVLLIAARFLSPALNMNYAYRDPIFNRSWGPAVLHLAVILAATVLLLYWPTHAILDRVFPPPLPRLQSSKSL